MEWVSADFALRANFCMLFLHRCVEEPQFPRQVLYTDECRFTRDAVLNSKNSHDENTLAQHADGFQQCSGINVWAGIVDSRLIGPYLLPPHLTGHTYFIFMQDVLGKLLEDLDIHRRLWFQHGDSPPHFEGAICDHLNRCFGHSWIGRSGPIAWPPRSPDFTPFVLFCGAT